jgi:hypothetical protein
MTPNVSRLKLSVELGEQVYLCRVKTASDFDLNWTNGREVQARTKDKVMYLKRSNGKVLKLSIVGTKRRSSSICYVSEVTRHHLPLLTTGPGQWFSSFLTQHRHYAHRQFLSEIAWLQPQYRSTGSSGSNNSLFTLLPLDFSL